MSIAVHAEEHPDVLELADFTWQVRQIGLESFLWKWSLVVVCVTRFLSRQGPGRQVLHLVQESLKCSAAARSKSVNISTRRTAQV
jgi:hypothetical protein